MTEPELQKIERELGIRLPTDYRSVMLAYPFPRQSFTAEHSLPNDADTIQQLAGVRENLPPHSFVIGDDGGEEIYFIDVSKHLSPVYVFQLETGKVKEQAANLRTYIEQCKQTEDEIQLDHKQMGKRNWWQLWK